MNQSRVLVILAFVAFLLAFLSSAFAVSPGVSWESLVSLGLVLWVGSSL